MHPSTTIMCRMVSQNTPIHHTVTQCKTCGADNEHITQGAKTERKLWNDRLVAVLETLDINKCVYDYGLYVWFYLGDIFIMNSSNDDVLLDTANEQARSNDEAVLVAYFTITTNRNPEEFRYLNWNMIQSDTHISMD